MDGNGRQTGAEELARILALPTKRFAFGDITREGKYDRDEGKFYFLDSNGCLSGQVAVMRDAPPEPVTETGETPAESKPEKGGLMEKLRKLAAGGEKAEEESPEENAGDGKTDRKKKIIFAVFAVFAVVLFTLAAVFLPKIAVRDAPPEVKFSPVPDSPAPSAPPSAPAAPPAEDLDTIDVIQVTEDLIPGDVISADTVRLAEISSESYNLINLGSSNRIYQWSRAESLIGKYATVYIPAGQYLTYENVSAVRSLPENPWINEEPGTAYVTVPLTAEAAADRAFGFGAYFDLVIKKQTVSETAAGDGEENGAAETAGLEHETTVQQSLVIDTWRVNGCIVCDILNADGESVFDRYAAYAGIPAGERMTYLRRALSESETLGDKIKPAAIRTKLTDEQAAALGDLSASGTTLIYTLTGEINANTPSKEEYAAETRALSATLAEAAELNAAETESTSNERQ